MKIRRDNEWTDQKIFWTEAHPKQDNTDVIKWRHPTEMSRQDLLSAIYYHEDVANGASSGMKRRDPKTRVALH